MSQRRQVESPVNTVILHSTLISGTWLKELLSWSTSYSTRTLVGDQLALHLITDIILILVLVALISFAYPTSAVIYALVVVLLSAEELFKELHRYF